MTECYCCGKEVDPQKANGINGKYGHTYYCKAKECQKQFIEDAGERLDSWYD